MKNTDFKSEPIDMIKYIVEEQWNRYLKLINNFW